MADKIISQDYLNYLFDYKDGELFWKNKTSQYANIKIGQKSGRHGKDSYLSTSINSKRYANHKIIFMMHKGIMPNLIDHIDGNPLNNKIENLRICNNSQNQCNRKMPKHNTSGVKGVFWNKLAKKWVVGISINKKTKYFGYYFDLEVAKFVADTMRHKYHGQFANHK